MLLPSPLRSLSLSLHDTRARWIAFKDPYIQGQRSSGRTLSLSLLSLPLATCAQTAPAGTHGLYYITRIESITAPAGCPARLARYIIALFTGWIIDRPLLFLSLSLRWRDRESYDSVRRPIRPDGLSHTPLDNEL